MPLFAVCGSAGGGAGADEEGPRKRALFVSQSQDLEHFQFETLRISNHTAGLSFRGKNAVFPLTFGRAALCRRLAFHLFQS